MAWMSYLASASVLAVVASNLPFLASLVGVPARIDKTTLVRWENSSPLNNHDCVVSKVADACEDVVIHHASNTAFLACGDPKQRTVWYPPASCHDEAGRSEASFREFLFKYDIKSGKTTPLKLEGLDGDFVTHGLDIFQLPNDKSKVFLFAVRHGRQGDSISIFEHQLGSDVVTLVKDVRHPEIKTANGVAAVGEFEFYVTNDHYFYSGPLRYFEERFGPFSWGTNVQYCDGSGETVQCRQVTESFPGANGIAVSDGRLFLGDARNGTVTIYRLREDKGADLERQVSLGAASDNLKVVPTTGDIIATVFPGLEDLEHYKANVEKLGKELRVASAALRLRKDRDFEPELIYFDEGGVLSDMTSMAIDPYNKVAIGGAVLQYGGFAVCKLSKATAKQLK